MSNSWLPISYRDFYDVPRLLAFSHAGEKFILDCPFDDVLDEYQDVFNVLRVRDVDLSALAGSDWREVVSRGNLIGVIRVVDVEFDPTTRQSINKSILSLIENLK